MCKKAIIAPFLLLYCCLVPIRSQNISTNIDWRLAATQYPTPDAFVYAFSVDQFGAKADGITDNTSVFQKALDKLKTASNNRSGGVLFVPAGKYVIKGNLNIPKGVTLRGEWKKPTKGQPIEGTILMAYAGRNIVNGTPFISMEPAAGVRDLAIWYPEQTADAIVPYPVSIVMGKEGYFGNNFCNVRNITLVNSYQGIATSKTNGGGCPVFYDIYGSPLFVGIEIDRVADVGRLDRIYFSPDYWSESGLENSPTSGGTHARWMYENGTGIMMRRNDWSYTCYVHIDGYNVGFNAAPSNYSPTETGAPNGHNYEITFTNCKTAVRCDALSNAGILFSRIHISGCENGFTVSPSVGATLHLMICDISATQNAIYTDPDISTRVMMQSCRIDKGNVIANGGILSCTDCDFNNPAPQIHIGKNARHIITGNRFKENTRIDNHSLFTGHIDHTPVNLKPMPEFPQISHNTQKQRPERNVLYVGNPSNGISESSPDCTESLQKLLDQAASEGGGIVFLPPGKYKFKGNIHIPTRVELKGSLDNSTTPVGPGSIIEVYAGKNNPNAAPFMTMQPYSGLRGVTFDYPEQESSLLPGNLHEYPYCVQVQGNDVYIVNVAIRAACYGFDLFTYKCDNHYIDYISGHSFKIGVKVGGGSENGKISNLQYNPICYSNGYETKFGSFSNSIKEYANAAGDYVFDNFQFLILGNCKNELLYNDFGVCVQRGLIFSKENEKGASGLSLGLGIDGSRRAIYFDHLDPQGFDLINSQIVASENKDKTSDSRYIETTLNFKGESTFFNSDYWGGAMQCFVARGGTLNFYTAWFSQNMPKYFGDLGGNSTINIVNSNITSMNTLLASDGESHLSMQSTVSDFNGIETGKCILWKNNLGNAPVLADIKPLDQTGWIASGSKNNGDAKYAIDGKDDSRWSSGSQKIPGDWFKIDMRTPQKFSTIILDSSKSPNDSPAKYELYISDDDINWGDPIATGVGGGMQTIINFPAQNARYFKIVQIGDTKTNYWSIHELKVLWEDTEAGIENAGLNSGKIYFSKDILYLDEFNGSSNIYIYNINGQKIYSCRTEENRLQLPLIKGIYSISVENKGKYTRSKLVVQ